MFISLNIEALFSHECICRIPGSQSSDLLPPPHLITSLSIDILINHICYTPIFLEKKLRNLWSLFSPFFSEKLVPFLFTFRDFFLQGPDLETLIKLQNILKAMKIAILTVESPTPIALIDLTDFQKAILSPVLENLIVVSTCQDPDMQIRIFR